MDLQEISELLLDDYREQMASSLWGKIDPRPSEKPEFNDAELDAEFTVYKSGLIKEENERLRREDLKDRFKNLKDMRQAFHSIHSEPNPDLWLKNLLFSDKDHAEAKILELEAVDLAQQNSPTKLMDDFIAARNAEYQAEGVSRDLILEALWEAVVENRPEKINALQPIREKVKNKIPKP